MRDSRWSCEIARRGEPPSRAHPISAGQPSIPLRPCEVTSGLMKTCYRRPWQSIVSVPTGHDWRTKRRPGRQTAPFRALRYALPPRRHGGKCPRVALAPDLRPSVREDYAAGCRARAPARARAGGRAPQRPHRPRRARGRRRPSEGPGIAAAVEATPARGKRLRGLERARACGQEKPPETFHRAAAFSRPALAAGFERPAQASRPAATATLRGDAAATLTALAERIAGRPPVSHGHARRATTGPRRARPGWRLRASPEAFAPEVLAALRDFG